MLDQDTLAGLRAALERERETLRKEIEGHGADPDSDELQIEVERGFSDSAHSTAERSRLVSLVRALRGNLRDVERALAKMDAGTYGTCEGCGKPIAPERLEALPWAAVCIECKQRGVVR